MTSSLLAASLIIALGQSPESVSTEPAAPEGSFLQTRLSFLAGDTDFGAPDATTRFHVALDARTAELASGLRAEAGLSLFLNPVAVAGTTLQDNASFFGLRYQPSSWAPDERLAMTVFPVRANRLYMGYENPVAWARISTMTRTGLGGEPGMELRLSRRRWDAFVAAKIPSLQNGVTTERERRLMLLAGAGVNLSQAFRMEAAAANLDLGPASVPYADARERDIYTRGVSGRMMWRHGVPVGANVDLELYEGDPTFFEHFFAPDVYPGGFGAHVALEGSYVTQQLLDSESTVLEATRKQAAHAAALVTRVKWNQLRLHALAYYRTPSFMVLSQPGFFPAESALFERTEALAELSATVGADYFLQDWGLTPGFLVRVTAPATLKSPVPRPMWPLITPLIVRGNNGYSALPVGEERSPILTAKATARWDLGEVAGVLAELFYTRDPNRTTYANDDTGVATVVWDSPDIVGGNLLLQVRF
ncbi:hypothetical protein [Myxococcus xanthus]|uniref:Uncharacterized protein n=2 Tax=Myxococcus xanthus TaxID=34 RepID=A0AAE6G803_MYXXA|nr:hypothetical protein [Myxococcus xanthus]QDE72628.1 hypothetical protein BHS09_27605 [Myxococcus xanthus]QDE79907.1 hypothetical protein BHS08_27625 [Myxococcus xanthus]QDE87282.1 hypothetical protein BHS07_28170 [Myxococcus xanthus]QDF06946.1 hypothetical protein BHS04_27715 [Myxococcus xanthus]